MFCCAVLFISGLMLFNPESTKASKSEDEIYLGELGLDKSNGWYSVLYAIEKIPVSMENQSPEELAKWLSKESGLTVTTDGEYLNFSQKIFQTREVTTGNGIKCAGALLQTIPVTKIFKVKGLINSLGGATTVVKQVYTNYKYWRSKKYGKKQALNQALDDLSVKNRLSEASKQLLLDFIGVSVIVGGCEDLFG